MQLQQLKVSATDGGDGGDVQIDLFPKDSIIFWIKMGSKYNNWPMFKAKDSRKTMQASFAAMLVEELDICCQNVILIQDSVWENKWFWSQENTNSVNNSLLI